MRIPVLILAASVSLAAGLLAIREIHDTKFDGPDERSLLFALIGAEWAAPRPLGRAAQTAILDGCARAQLSPSIALFPASDRKKAATHCLAMADKYLEDTTVSAIAHYARAVSALTLNDRDMMSSALQLSQVSGPYEGWIAERRVDLALRDFDRISAATRKTIRKDLQLVAAEPQYRTNMARRYLRYPEGQAWIASVIENLSEADQGAFLAATRKVASSSE
jgi:hypothetical protein